MFEIRHYIDSTGHAPFKAWIKQIRDIKARTAIDRRIYRIEQGNFGDCKPLQDGVWELRIDVGPGYRVYYAIEDKTVVLLLCGGDKRRQDADIQRACEYWRKWQESTP